MQNYWRWGQCEFSPRWRAHPMRKFALAIPTCCYLKTLKLCLTPNAKHKICVTPTQNPNASQWNIGCVGSPTQHFCVGHVDFMCFFSHWVPNANAVLSDELHTEKIGSSFLCQTDKFMINLALSSAKKEILLCASHIV